MHHFFAWQLFSLLSIVKGSNFDNQAIGEASSSMVFNEDEVGFNDLAIPSGSADNRGQYPSTADGKSTVEAPLIGSGRCRSSASYIPSNRRTRRGVECPNVAPPTAVQDNTKPGDGGDSQKQSEGINLPEVQMPQQIYPQVNMQICPGAIWNFPVCAMDEDAEIFLLGSGTFILKKCHICRLPPEPTKYSQGGTLLVAILVFTNDHLARESFLPMRLTRKSLVLHECCTRREYFLTNTRNQRANLLTRYL